MTFWTKASTEERLAQIDGGISVGMTSKQIAMCLGAPIYDDGYANAVKSFGQYHGRHFPTPQDVSAAKGRKVGIRTVKTMAGRKHGVPEILNKDAFAIFDTPRDPNPFASLSFEEIDA